MANGPPRATGSPPRRTGLTLVEMLVATAITLLIVYGMAHAFATLSQLVSLDRATIEMASQLRGVAMQLQQDMEGVTVPMRPWVAGSSGMGYFEYYEGPEMDYDAARTDTHVGDFDDLLMFTTRNTEHPFRGRIANAYLDGSDANTLPDIDPISTVAEVIWWLRLNDTNGNGTWDAGELFTLHRRTLLVLPELNAIGSLPTTAAVSVADFLNENDLSIHVDGSGQIVANSLSDLSNRRYRFAHLWYAGSGYPIEGFPYLIDLSNGLLNPAYVLHTTRAGEDVILSNALGFDVRAYDPLAPVQQDASGIDALVPGDPGYGGAGATTIGAGAYVDLDYATALGISVTSVFSGPPQFRSGLSGRAGTSRVGSRPYRQPKQVVYDTWTADYESDGVNQDAPPTSPPIIPLFPTEMLDDLTDEGMDGEDNTEYISLPPGPTATGPKNGVDDVGERETSPPYPIPLRGIQVRIRMYEPSTRQVRQLTVTSDFVPE